MLDPIWAVYNNKKRKLSETEGNRYPDTRWLRADIIEYHRGYPVLSTDDRTLFMSNRKTRDKAFGRRLAAFAVDRDCPREDGSCAGGAITTDQLRWSYRGEAGMVAAPGLGRTRCSDPTCCTEGAPVDTVFIGDKNKNFTALEHCSSGEPHKKWGDDADRFRRAKVRSTPLVVERDIESGVAGTAFVGNEDDGSSRGYFYAVNAETGKVRWLHYLGNDNKDDDNGSNFACAAAAAPATQTGCHPPPLVYASVGSGQLNDPVDPELRCVPADTATLALEIKALLHPDADAVSGVRIREEGVEGWMEQGCVSVPCAVDLPGPFDVAREYTIEVSEGGKAGYATVALAPCA